VQPVFLVVLLGYLTFEPWRRSDRAKWGDVPYMRDSRGEELALATHGRALALAARTSGPTVVGS
jgi:hypothetical protein